MTERALPEKVERARIEYMEAAARYGSEPRREAWTSLLAQRTEELRAAILEALEEAREACALESHRVLGDHYDDPDTAGPAPNCSGCESVRKAT